MAFNETLYYAEIDTNTPAMSPVTSVTILIDNDYFQTPDSAQIIITSDDGTRFTFEDGSTMKFVCFSRFNPEDTLPLLKVEQTIFYASATPVDVYELEVAVIVRASTCITNTVTSNETRTTALRINIVEGMSHNTSLRM